MNVSHKIVKQNAINQRKPACTKASNCQNANYVYPRRNLHSNSMQQKIDGIYADYAQNRPDDKIIISS